MPTSLRIHRHVLRSRSTSRFSAALPEDITSKLADALRAIVPVDRGGLWLIRRLDVRAAAAPGSASDAIAGALATALLRELERTLDAGANDPDIQWYPDRAAFLAQWLVDVRSGQAGQGWAYRAFAAESSSAAMRARADAEPDALLEALRRLPLPDLDDVVALLAPADAAAVVHALTQRPDSIGAAELAATAAHLARSGRLPGDPRCATLLIVLAHGGSPGAGDAGLARDLALVVLDVRACSWTDRAALLAALHDGDWASAARLGATAAATALAGWPAAARAAAISELTAPAAAPSDPVADRGHTGFGGQFLLLPLLRDLPFEPASTGWPRFFGAAPQVALGVLATIGVLGTEHILTDPYFRLATGVPPCAIEDLARWVDDVGDSRLTRLRAAFDDAQLRHADGMRADLTDDDLLVPALSPVAARMVRIASSALLRELAYRLPGFATASAAHLRRNVLALDADVTIEEDRYVVALGHPPLNLLLSLTGMNRRSVTLDATGNRPWVMTSRR